MKTKKKSIQTKSINTIRLLNVRTVQQEKNNNQKTFATIEQNYKTHQNTENQAQRLSLKARFSFNKKSYVERMEQNNLSPFSNDGRSFSPKYRKTPQKLLSAREDKDIKFGLNLKQFEKKKLKSKANSARQARQGNQNNNKKLVINKTVSNNNILPIQQSKKKTVVKKKPIKQDKKQKQEKARIQFQNEFLNMMNTRIRKQKITEKSQQQFQCLIKRKPKLQIAITSSQASSKQPKYFDKNTDKREIVKTMKMKIMQNINRDYPNLDHSQKKVMSAIIIIQRLWRQRKVKQFFQHYLTPRASLESSSFRESMKKQVQSNNSTMNLLSTHIIENKKSQGFQSCETAPKKKIQSKNEKQSYKFQQDNFLIRQKSSDSVKQPQTQIKQLFTPTQSKLNQKVNKLLQDSILSFQNENEKIVNQTSHQLDKPSMIKFVECYRQVKLNKKSSKSKRNNIFSLKQSLSQKCLMQKYYQRIFADKPQKDKPKNYELFSLTNNHSNLGNESLKLNQQSSIEIFKEISKHPDYISPQKLLKKQNQNETKLENQKEQEEEWVRNETSYSQQTDSDELIANKKLQEKSPKKQPIFIVDKISHHQSFIKTKIEINETQIEFLTPKKDDISNRNKITQIRQDFCVKKADYVKEQEEELKNVNLPKEQKPQYSLKSIQNAADSIMVQLMDEFFKQYLSFQQKQCLVKKRKQKNNKQEQKPKKPKLPGIQITPKSITQYLNILVGFILKNDRQQILRSLELFHPSTYQKCHRVESPVYEIFEFGDQEEDDIYWNIISNEWFFSCLEKFWKENVTLSKENEKFTNFIDLTYKVYNRCITDAFSQIFNKVVLQRVCYPWNSLKKCRNRLIFDGVQKGIINQEQIQKMAYQVKEKVLRQSFCYSTTGGKLKKKQKRNKQQQVKEYQFGEKPQQQELVIQKLEEEEFNKVMKIANQEFLQDEKELINCLDERYELNGDLSESILEQLLKQFQEQIGQLNVQRQSESKQFTKSQQQVFLQTNQTLETNNYNP